MKRDDVFISTLIKSKSWLGEAYKIGEELAVRVYDHELDPNYKEICKHNACRLKAHTNGECLLHMKLSKLEKKPYEGKPIPKRSYYNGARTF